MAHYHATIDSPRGPAETFDYLATFSNAAQWDPGVLSGEQLDPGPVRVGTRFRLVVPFLGRRLPLTYVVALARRSGGVVGGPGGVVGGPGGVVGGPGGVVGGPGGVVGGPEGLAGGPEAAG